MTVQTSAFDRAAGDVVLIVDDQPDNLSMLHDALDESGYTVLVATHGEGALQRAAQAQPDIVLLDAMMPGMDGFEVARRLKADPATAAIPIVFMTGLTETEHVLAAFAAGGVDYVTKPIRPREVLARLAAHVNNARQAHQARNALDAFGHATLVVRAGDGRLVWQTALARQMLQQWFGGDSPWTPPPLLDWVRQQVAAGAVGSASQAGSLVQGARRLHFTLHESTGEDEWLIVLREANDAAMLEGMMLAFKLTAREAEVLYWVVKGKTNRDVGDILGASAATVKKHLERVYEKLGVETRTAAAALAIQRVRQLGR
ncbi:response regulator transcription factor [Aquincola tertiaricarbonis]|uniref:response regulator transcription factor n=1 Tax=Aquincola tertiaricarbonis TaxID=391953 RepID=UPI000614A443|nr:response regulator transcription factor [Aquincola tertiaricarbonis]